MIPTVHHYFHSGLQIRSDWEIGDWAAFETSPLTGKPDVSIYVRDSHTPRDENAFTYDVPEIGCYVVRDGAEIVVIPEPDCDPEDAKVFLTSAAWGALCHQRGIHLIHGSAIRVNGRVFAFSGYSGAGKSTMVASLVQKGYEMVVDDLSRLDVWEERVVLYPTARRLKLWSETVQELGRELDGLPKVLAYLDKYCVPMPGQESADPIPLDALYLLCWGDLDLRRLTGIEAMQSFLNAATYRPEIICSLGQEPNSLKHALEVVTRVPIYELSRPKDFAEIGHVVSLLEKHWNDDFS